MLANSLNIKCLRNHSHTETKNFAPLVNVIIGPNGAGKTSIIEAILVSALSKSFISTSDAALVRTGESGYSIAAGFTSSLGVGVHVTVDYQLGPPAKKTIHINNDRLRSSAELIGRIPIVAMTPDDKVITSGSPDERRRFLNLVLSQASHKYLLDEIEYRKAVKHRNSLLNDLSKKNYGLQSAKPQIEPWTEMVVKFAVPIMTRRANFIEEFRPFLLESYRLLSDGKEEPMFRYAPMNLSQWDGATNFESLIRKQIELREAEELRRGTTLAGAHRDEMIVMIDPERDAKNFASQGQHKTLLVAMKLAEFNYLKDACGETPILLLDDVFSELDASRAKCLLELIAGGTFGQTFITSTTRESFDAVVDFSGDKNRMFVVESGQVK